MRFALPLLLLAPLSCTPAERAKWEEANRPPEKRPRAKVDVYAQTEPNVVQAHTIFSTEPWLSYSRDGSGQINGVKFALYLESGRASKGVFGDGNIIILMYRIDRDATGVERATRIYQWELTAEQAYPCRAKEKTGLGWGYGMRLPWDPKLDVEDKQISLVVKYVRSDGRVITSSPKMLKVPVRGHAIQGLQ